MSLKFVLYFTIINLFNTKTVTPANSSKLVDTTLSIANQLFYDLTTVIAWKNDYKLNKANNLFDAITKETDDKAKFEKALNKEPKIFDIQEDVMQQFLEKYKGKIILLTEGNVNIDLRKMKFTQVIVFAENVGVAKELIKVFKEVIIPVNMVIIMTATTSKDSISELTKTAWNNDVGDVLILTEDDNDENKIVTVKAWTYFPYRHDECDNTEPVEQHLTDVKFPQKFFNFYQCPVKVTLLPLDPYLNVTKENGTVTSIGGLDGELLTLVVEKLNSSMEVVCSEDHGGFGTYRNGTATGSFRDLVEKEADIIVPALVMTQGRYSAAQISIVFSTVDAVWCGPMQKEVYVWAKVFLPFYSIFTAYLILSFIVFIVTTKIVRKYALCHPETRKGVFLQAFILFLGQEVRFETKCWLVNSMFVMWLWFCMVMRIAYQGQLVNGLQKVILEPPLGTFDEAIKELGGFGGEEVFRDYIHSNAAKKYQVIDVDDMGPRIKDIGKGKRFLLITDVLILQVYKAEVQVLDEAAFRTPVCVHMRPGWPASKAVAQIITQLVETGLIEKVMQDFDYEMKRSTQSEPTAAPLTMTKLGALFFGLYAMFVLCCLIFCGEILYFRYKLNYNTWKLETG